MEDAKWKKRYADAEKYLGLKKEDPRYLVKGHKAYAIARKGAPQPSLYGKSTRAYEDRRAKQKQLIKGMNTVVGRKKMCDDIYADCYSVCMRFKWGSQGAQSE